jgi:hypothetical protein
MLNANYINADINSLTILDDNEEPIYSMHVVKEEAKVKTKQPTILLKLPIKRREGDLLKRRINEYC